MTISAVIFDLDDTLTPEWQFIQSGLDYIAEILVTELRAASFADARLALRDAYDTDSTRVFDGALTRLAIPPSQPLVEDLVHAYRHHKPTLHYYPDVIETLAALKSLGIQTGIITDGYTATQRNKIAALNANAHVDEIIVTDELGRDFWKPHPRAFELLASRFDSELTAMAYVGDNPRKDFIIGSTHGVTTVRIIRERGVHTILPYTNGITEHVRIDSLRDVLTRLPLATANQETSRA